MHCLGAHFPCAFNGALGICARTSSRGVGQAVWFGGRPGPPEAPLRFAHLLCEYCAEWLRSVGFIHRSGGLRDGVQSSAIGGVLNVTGKLTIVTRQLLCAVSLL